MQERVALVTGGARRIGAATVRALHSAGARVVIHYRGSLAEARASLVPSKRSEPTPRFCLTLTYSTSKLCRA
jgi:pteridine reductase